MASPPHWPSDKGFSAFRPWSSWDLGHFEGHSFLTTQRSLYGHKSCKKSHFYFITVIITQLIPKLTLPHFSMNFQFFTIFTSNLTSIWPSSTPKAEFWGLEILFLAANKIRLFSSETKLLCDRVLFCLRFLKTKKNPKKNSSIWRGFVQFSCWPRWFDELFFEINFRKISEILSEEYPEIRRVWKVLVLLRVRYFKREQKNYYLLFLLRNYWENWQHSVFWYFRGAGVFSSKF